MILTDDPEYQSLLRKVLEEPGDDLPRLTLADWLESWAWEVDGCAERAVFIRLQLAGRTKWSYDRAEKWRTDTETLLRVNGHGWLGEWYTHGNGRSWVWSGGFVSEIRCTLAQFVGAECGCGGQSHPFQSFCCHGTGRIPGIAAKVFAEHPVTRVVLTDREPTYNVTPRNGWFWRCTSDGYPRSNINALPGFIWKYLPPGIGNSFTWPTREAALEALSAAAVAYGRQLAGLPPLTVTISAS